jgi:hypothetical protein
LKGKDALLSYVFQNLGYQTEIKAVYKSELGGSFLRGPLDGGDFVTENGNTAVMLLSDTFCEGGGEDDERDELTVLKEDCKAERRLDVHWCTRPEKFVVSSTYTAYGNESTLTHLYASAALLVKIREVTGMLPPHDAIEVDPVALPSKFLAKRDHRLYRREATLPPPISRWPAFGENLHGIEKAYHAGHYVFAFLVSNVTKANDLYKILDDIDNDRMSVDPMHFRSSPLVLLRPGKDNHHYDVHCFYGDLSPSIGTKTRAFLSLEVLDVFSLNVPEDVCRSIISSLQK